VNEQRFWQLIDESRAAAGGARDMASAAEQADHLEELLLREAPADIVDFERLFSSHLARSYDWGLWGAAYVINGGCSDDAFDYFRAWLIGQGKAVFDAALADPDSLVERVDDEIECEELLYVAGRAYEERTGDDLPSLTLDLPDEPRGTSWDEEDLPKRFPRLSERFGMPEGEADEEDAEDAEEEDEDEDASEDGDEEAAEDEEADDSDDS
jgi:hypothetical protein